MILYDVVDLFQLRTLRTKSSPRLVRNGENTLVKIAEGSRVIVDLLLPQLIPRLKGDAAALPALQCIRNVCQEDHLSGD